MLGLLVTCEGRHEGDLERSMYFSYLVYRTT
jgi:hypothetical protein